MKTPNHIRFALLAAATLFSHVTFAGKPPPPPPPPQLENWLTVDDVQNIWNEAMTVAPSGVLFAAGYGDTGQAYVGVIRTSADSGNTWATTSVFQYPGLDTTFFSAIASDSAGNLYVSGLAHGDWITYPNDGGLAHWFVQRSGDGGVTWSMVDDFIPGGDWWWWEYTTLAVDAAGTVFFGCAPNGGSGYNTYWTIRRGIGGANFTTVDTLAYPNDDGPHQVYAHPTAGVFAVGYDRVVTPNKNGTTSSSSAWIVRRSLDGGTTWQTINTYQLNSGRYASAAGIGSDASGNLYVVGNAVGPAVRGSYWRHWIVRKSADGGNSWTTVDDYQLDTNNNCWARGFRAAANGNLYVIGSANDGTGSNPHWVVRKSVGGTGTWTTVDDFRYANTGSAPYSIAADAFGKVFVGGYGGGHWVVRRSP